MKMKFICFFSALVFLSLTACSQKPAFKESSSSESSTAKIYYDYLVSSGEIETEKSQTTGGGFKRWNVNDLYYYVDDFNDDEVIDLAISNEKSDSNGFEIYTYKNGQIKKLFSKGMPYSAGTEIYTLAKYDDNYGIKYLRNNSTGDFSFYSINKDADIKEMFSGFLYDIDGNVLDTSNSYDKIKPITFYGIEELEKMF